MTNDLKLEALHKSDIEEIASAFKQIGWHKPKEIYESYLEEQSAGLRSVIIAKTFGKFCGYVTLKWNSDYQSFNEQNIPEIADLNVLPEYRKQSVGTTLIKSCEDLANADRRFFIGLGVGLTADYGSAQRLYIHLGFVPDGKGIHYNCKPIKYFEHVTVDDYLVLYLTKNLNNKKGIK